MELPPPFLGEEESSEERKQLAKLLFPQYFENSTVLDLEAFETEIKRLATNHPEVFDKHFVVKARRGSPFGDDRRSPLSKIMSFIERNYNGHALSTATFEAAYKAFPGAVQSVDSWGDTILLDLIGNMQRHQVDYDKCYDSNKKVQLLKFIISKSSDVLATVNGSSPISIAVQNGFPEPLVQYMIDHHPGDPFREASSTHGHSLLGHVVRNSQWYSLDFVRYVLDQNPEAARVTKKGRYSSTVLHEACKGGKVPAAVVSLVLEAFPRAAFEPGRDRDMPIYDLTTKYALSQPFSKVQQAEFRKKLAMIALANPRAAFVNYEHHKQSVPSSAFSNVYSRILARGRKGDDHSKSLWSYIYFLMNVYRFGTDIAQSEAWQPPKHALHLAASTPCSSQFLLDMAKANPDQMLQVDKEDRTVLALALESGHSMVKKRRGDDWHNDAIKHCIQQLVQVDIRAVSLRDPKTRLYPFQTAASMKDQIVEIMVLDDSCIRDDYDKSSDYTRKYHEGLMKDVRDEAPLICLNTIYFLLRADPTRVGPDHEYK